MQRDWKLHRSALAAVPRAVDDVATLRRRFLIEHYIHDSRGSPPDAATLDREVAVLGAFEALQLVSARQVGAVAVPDAGEMDSHRSDGGGAGGGHPPPEDFVMCLLHLAGPPPPPVPPCVALDARGRIVLSVVPRGLDGDAFTVAVRPRTTCAQFVAAVADAPQAAAWRGRWKLTCGGRPLPADGQRPLVDHVGVAAGDSVVAEVNRFTPCW